jgi:hypothetical protein
LKTIIDIGTHKAEELRVLLSDPSYILFEYVRWLFDWFKRQVKKIIKYDGLIEYGTGGYKMSPFSKSLKDHAKIISKIFKPSVSNLIIVLIDPQINVLYRYIAGIQLKNSVHTLPIAIYSHREDKSCSLETFTIDKDSLSSGLDYKKSIDSKVKTLVPCFDFSVIISALRSVSVIEDSSEVLLRMNCEGAELAIIKASISQGLNIKLVLGSLYDCEKIFGDGDILNGMLENNNIKSYYFKGSDPSTWCDAFEYFDEFINEKT